LVVEVVDGERRDGGICEDCIICPVINDDGDVRKNAVFDGRGEVEVEVEVEVDVGEVDVGEVDDDGGVTNMFTVVCFVAASFDSDNVNPDSRLFNRGQGGDRITTREDLGRERDTWERRWRWLEIVGMEEVEKSRKSAIRPRATRGAMCLAITRVARVAVEGMAGSFTMDAGMVLEDGFDAE
jgi:hypothetical protein